MKFSAPGILWNDGRSFAGCANLEEAVPDSRAITGNLAMPGFTAPKLGWVRKHEPEVFARVRTVLLPKDYLRLWMTGDKASDVSDSAGTLWLDVAARDWSDAMLEATGLSHDHMPLLFEGPEVTGPWRAEIASEWGMERVPLVAGAGDNAAGAAGIGVVRDGVTLLSLGTSGVTFVAGLSAQSRARRPCLLPLPAGHVAPDGVHLSAASCVDWAARQLGLTGPAEVFALAEQAGAAAGPELFLPYLSGERTPHNDPHIRGAWLGLDNETTPARLAAAVLEGVALAHADGLLALREAGTQVGRRAVIGGGARSRYWGRILAATLEADLDYLEGGEVGPALGAAKLARMGMTGEDAATACTRPPVAATIALQHDLAARLGAKLEIFRAAYPALAKL